MCLTKQKQSTTRRQPAKRLPTYLYSPLDSVVSVVDVNGICTCTRCSGMVLLVVWQKQTRVFSHIQSAGGVASCVPFLPSLLMLPLPRNTKGNTYLYPPRRSYIQVKLNFVETKDPKLDKYLFFFNEASSTSRRGS